VSEQPARAHKKGYCLPCDRHRHGIAAADEESHGEYYARTGEFWLRHRRCGRFGDYIGPNDEPSQPYIRPQRIEPVEPRASEDSRYLISVLQAMATE
jgi:hypothetical protein